MTMLGTRHGSTDTEQALGILRAKNIEVAKQLKAEDAKKWTQAKIAVALGVTQQAVDKWLGDISDTTGCKANTDARLTIPAVAMKREGVLDNGIPFDSDFEFSRRRENLSFESLRRRKNLTAP